MNNDRELVVSFSVDCQNADIPRVRDLLVDLGMTTIVSSDNHIHGMCEMGELRDIVRVLSKERSSTHLHEIELVTRPNKAKYVN